MSAILPDDLAALLGDTVGTLGSALLAKLAEIVTNEVDLFYPFYPKIQKGAPENEWRLLHLRPRQLGEVALYQLLGATEIHLVYPATLRERPSAEPCPLPQFGVYPDVMSSAGSWAGSGLR